VGGAPADFGVPLANSEAGSAGGDDDRGDFGASVGPLSGDRGDGDERGDVGAGVGDEAVGAVDDPFSGIEAGGGAGGARIGAAFGFGEAERAEGFSGAEPGQPGGLLFRGAEPVDRHCAEGDGGFQGDGDGRVDAGEFFQGEAERQVVAAHAADVFGERQAEQAHAPHGGDDLVGEGGAFVVVADDRRDFGAGEFGDGAAQFFVFVAETVGHQRGSSVAAVVDGTWVAAGAAAGVTTARRASRGPDCPGRACSSVTVPSTGAATGCSIFMASTTARVCPARTVSPTATGTSRTVPGM